MSHIHVLHLMTYSSQLVRTEKPTGRADCPPEIDRAHAVEAAMNEKAGTRDLDDKDIIDTEALDTSDDENLPPTPFPIPLPPKGCKAKTEAGNNTGPVVRRVASTLMRAQPKNDAHSLLKTLSNALDPNAQLVRTQERTTHSFQMAQVLTLSNQLRDAQAIIETLHGQLSVCECERNTAERRADRSEMLALLKDTHIPVEHPPAPFERPLPRLVVKHAAISLDSPASSPPLSKASSPTPSSD